MKLNEVINIIESNLATTFDSKTEDNTIVIVFNGKKMGIKSFLELAKKDVDARKVLGCIKKHKDYNGNILDFIKNYLKSDDRIIDILLKSNGSCVFDEKEIRKNQGYDDTPIPSCRIFDKRFTKEQMEKWNEPKKKEKSDFYSSESKVIRRGRN